MKLRVLTALVMAPLAFWVVGWSPPWLFLIVLLLFVERGFYEYNRISHEAGFKTVPGIGYVATGAICLAQAAGIYWPGISGNLVLILLASSFLLTLLIALWRPSEPKQFLSATASTVFGILYVGFTLSWLIPLRFSDPVAGRNWTLLLFLVIWSGDICALLVGRTIGRTTLIPRISPGKTVEGSLGGLVGSLVVGGVFAHWVWQTAPLPTVILFAALIAVAGQVGDLVESALKRAGDVKDSGSILPGHGGFLDRIDSLILAAPALWIAITIFQSMQY
jgi:phosphatidate cytidylyltransferase